MSAYTLARFDDGTVLASDGWDRSNVLDSAELYDP